MAAPDFPTLYNFEDAFEDAYAAIVETALGEFFPGKDVQVAKTRERVELLTPRIEITFTPGNALEQMTTQGQSIPKQVPNSFNGSYSIRVVTCRKIVGNDAELHGQLVGLMRYLTSAGAQVFTSGNLPYYQILQCMPASTNFDVFEEKLQDGTSLDMPMIFAIRNDAWPTEEPPSVLVDDSGNVLVDDDGNPLVI